MPILDEAPPFTLVGLQTISTSHPSLFILHFLTTEADLLANPDIPVYPSQEACLSTLQSSLSCPPGTSRLFPLSHFLSHLSKPLRKTLSFPFNGTTHNCRYFPYSLHLTNFYIQSDIPIVTSPTATDTLLRYGPLPSFISFDSPLLIHTSSVLLSLPTYKARRLPKSGKPPRSPKAAIDTRRTAWLAARSLPFPLLPSFRSALSSLLFPTTSTYGSGSPFSSPPYVYNTPPHNSNPTWRDLVLHTSDNAALLAHYITGTLLLSSFPAHHGIFRSPISFLRHPRHLPSILALIALFHPHLPFLSGTSFPDPDSRLSTSDRNTITLHYAQFRRALYHLLRALGRRSFPTPSEFPIPSSLSEHFV